MDSELTMNYVVLLFSATSEETPFEQKFLLISAKEKKTKLMMTIKQNDFLIFFQVKLGLIIDLTNTTRFYDKTEVERAGINHVKMNCKGLVKYLCVLYAFSSSLQLTCIHKMLKI